MAQTKINSDINKEDKYESEQQGYWEQLRQELNSYKEDLEATNVELAEGLKISRTSLVSFLKSPSVGLPIERVNILRLFDYITDSERLKDQNISEDAKSKRKKLKKQGPDNLLKTAGFLPSVVSAISNIEDNQQKQAPPQIERIVSRLKKLLENDRPRFSQLSNYIEGEINIKSLPSSNRYSIDSDNWEADKENKKIKTFLKDVLGNEPEPQVFDKFKRAIDKLISWGHCEFHESELSAFYTSILDNEKVFKDIDRNLRVIECHFEKLTFEVLNGNEENQIRETWNKSVKNAEGLLIGSSLIEEDKHEYLPMVIEASVVCNVRKLKQNLCWQYSSSTTHMENVLAAIEQGIGYCPKLELIDFSCSSLGSNNYSLERASVAYIDKENQNKIYQGVWVDRSLILGLVQATVIAGEQWLYKYFSSAEERKDCYEVWIKLTNIERILSEGIKLFNDNVTEVYQGENEPISLNEEYFQKAIDNIKEIKSNILRRNAKLKELYDTYLNRLYYIAQLMQARLSLMKGDIKKAAVFLYDGDYKEANYEPLSVLYVGSEMIYKLFKGEVKYLNSNKWQDEWKEQLGILKGYIKAEKPCANTAGRVNFDTYWAASEISGSVGRLEFYCGESNSKDSLDKAIDNFLCAAYYASKIGQKHRCAHWLVYASRTYSRLGDGEKAKKLSEIAERILDETIDPRYYNEYQKSIKASIYLSRGERLLLVEGKYKESLKELVEAWQRAKGLKFNRLIADSLYSIARVTAALDKNSQLWQGNKDEKTAINQYLDKVVEDGNCKSVSEHCLQEAKNIWNTWFREANSAADAVHPIVIRMENNDFVGRLK